MTVVWTNGCFDLFHIGHLQSLRAAKRLGDFLIVGVNSDEAVRRLKGQGRPIWPLAARLEIVAAVRCVDRVVAIEDDPVDAIRNLKPDVVCKGEDWQGKPMPEIEVVKSYGGRIVFLPLVPGWSTTDLVRRINGE